MTAVYTRRCGRAAVGRARVESEGGQALGHVRVLDAVVVARLNRVIGTLVRLVGSG
jgi:hypothetical protein